MSFQDVISTAEADFQKALTHLREEFSRLQVGRANAGLVESIMVDMYGVAQPMKAVANISIPDPRTIQIQPWDKSAIIPIEKAIIGVGTGLNPNSDGVVIRINIPPLTEERRVDLTKQVRKLAEDAKISIRTARQDAHNTFKQLKADGDFTEDDLRDADKKLQQKVDDANHNIDEVTKTKEQDVMKI